MKTKSGTTKKKLALNKISITRLDRDIINRAKGGVTIDTEGPTCHQPDTEYLPQCIDPKP